MRYELCLAKVCAVAFKKLDYNHTLAAGASASRERESRERRKRAWHHEISPPFTLLSSPSSSSFSRLLAPSPRPRRRRRCRLFFDGSEAKSSGTTFSSPAHRDVRRQAAIACARAHSRAHACTPAFVVIRARSFVRSLIRSFVRSFTRSVLPLAVENDISRRAGNARRPRTHREKSRRAGAARPRRLRSVRRWRKTRSTSLSRVGGKAVARGPSASTMAISSWMIWGRSLRTGRTRRSACTAKLRLINEHEIAQFPRLSSSRLSFSF